MIDVSKCPFCGYEEPFVERYFHDAGIRYRVVCPECMATVDPGWFQSAGMAIEVWNRRIKHAD